MTRASAPEAPGARLGRSLSPLGNCQGCFKVGAALAAVGSRRGSHGDLVPGDLLVDGDGHEHLQSVGGGRTYPLGAGYQISCLGLDGRSVVVALFMSRQVLVPIATFARVRWPGLDRVITVGHGLPVAAAAGLVPAPSHQTSERPT